MHSFGFFFFFFSHDYICSAIGSPLAPWMGEVKDIKLVSQHTDCSTPLVSNTTWVFHLLLLRIRMLVKSIKSFNSRYLQITWINTQTHLPSLTPSCPACSSLPCFCLRLLLPTLYHFFTLFFRLHLHCNPHLGAQASALGFLWAQLM